MTRREEAEGKTERITCTIVPDKAPPLEAMEQKGDLLIRDLGQNGTDSVHEMRVVNTDTKSH